ncbi:MAG: hypothetical protein FWB74_08950, partial [Defluviitaleaceae bacterium]|nr:hypothetical protein [Defluviitaleaceae bacterium]
MKNLLAKRLYIGVCWSAGLVVAWSLFFALLVFWVQPFPTSQVLGFLVFFLNFLPIVICMIVLFFATNNTVFSIAATGFAVTILSIVNRFKIALRQDPLTSWDFVLGAEVFNSLRTSDPSLGFLLFFVLVFGVVLIGGLAWFIRNKKMPTILRLPGLVLSLALAVLVTNTTMSSINLFQSIEVIGTRHRMEDYFNSRGFLYAFIHTHLRWEISQPEGFNAAQVREQIDALPAPEGSHPAQLPHIFMILSEAFTDLSESPYFHFHEGHEPLYNFINMANEGHWGHIVVPNYGGGTADTEFDILTGINSRQFRATAYSNRLITRPFAGLTQ